MLQFAYDDYVVVHKISGTSQLCLNSGQNGFLQRLVICCTIAEDMCNLDLLLTYINSECIRPLELQIRYFVFQFSRCVFHISKSTAHIEETLVILTSLQETPLQKHSLESSKCSPFDSLGNYPTLSKWCI